MAVPTMSRCTMLRWSKCPRLHRDSLANLSLSHVSFLLLFVSKVNMVLNVHRNHKAYSGQGGKGLWRWEKREIIYLSLHCHHQTDSRIKMGSDKSCITVLLIVRDNLMFVTSFT